MRLTWTIEGVFNNHKLEYKTSGIIGFILMSGDKLISTRIIEYPHGQLSFLKDNLREYRISKKELEITSIKFDLNFK
jgi:hypothetical protein